MHNWHNDHRNLGEFKNTVKYSDFMGEDERTRYRNSTLAKIDIKFEKLIDKVGGDIVAILLLILLFVVIMVTVFSFKGMLGVNSRVQFDNSVFRFHDIDQGDRRRLVLIDQRYRQLELRVTRADSAFSMHFLGNTTTLIRDGDYRSYVFSDGSHGSNSTAHYVFPVGQVPHFTPTQQDESIAINAAVDFLQGYTPTYIVVLITLGGAVVLFFCLLGTFFLEFFHELRSPFMRVWEAELQARWIDNLGGRVSTLLVAVEFSVVLTMSILLVHAIV